MKTIKTKITEKKEREGERIASWVVSIGFLALTSIFIILWGIEGFAFQFKIQHFITLGFTLLISSCVGFLAWVISFQEEYIRTKEYAIFEFEIWDKDTARYVKRYSYSVNSIWARYFMNFQIGNSEHITTTEDIEKRYSGESIFVETPYSSKETVMLCILDEIKSSINNKMEEEKIKIKNITTSEVITVEELIKMVKSGNE